MEWFKLGRWCRKHLRIVLGVLVLSFILLSIMFPVLWTQYPQEAAELADRLQAPSRAHWMGCDLYGQDVLTALLYGARVSFYIATLSVLLAMSIGLCVGLVAGYYGGWWDLVTMRILEIFMAFPGILLAMALSSLLGPSMNNIILALSLTGWPATARMVRNQVLALKQRDFVLAAQSLGAGSLRIMRKELFPLLLPQLFITASFSFAGVILVEASLSFLGLSSINGPPTWGALLNQGRSVLAEAPHLSLYPGFFLVLVVWSFNLLGDGLRDAMDHRY